MAKKNKNEFSNLDANEILEKVEKWEMEKKVFKKQPFDKIRITKAGVDAMKKLEEDEKKELEKKTREEKRILEKEIEKKIKNSKLNKLKNKKRKFFFKLKKKDFIEGEDKTFLKEFLLMTFISGAVLNYVFLIIFGSIFTLYSFPAYGIIYWLSLKQLPGWARKFWERGNN